MFDKQSKSTIDTIVPIAGTALVYYYYFRKMKTDIKDKVIYIAIVWLILYLATSRITKNILKENSDIEDKIWAQNYGNAGGAFPTGKATIDAVSAAQKFKDDIYSWAPGRDSGIYKDAVEMTANNLGEVAIQYKSITGKSLYSDMKGEVYNNYEPLGFNYYAAAQTIMKRLETLKLT